MTQRIRLRSKVSAAGMTAVRAQTPVARPWGRTRTVNVVRGRGLQNGSPPGSALATRQREARLIHRCMADARRDGGEDSYNGKRRDKRTRWQMSVMVELNAGTPQRRMINATTRDISASGVGLSCRAALKPNSEVRIYVGDGDEYISATVRHCTRSLPGFIIGVEFDVRQDDPPRFARTA